MAKRSQRRPLRYENDQGGCISGLMSIFDFRYGRAPRKLLADSRRGSKQRASKGFGTSSATPTLPSKEKRHNPRKAEDTKTTDAVKPSVKILMEEEMINEKLPEKQMNVSRGGLEEFNLELGTRARKHHRRRSKTSRSSIDMDTYGEDTLKIVERGKFCKQVTEQKTFENANLETLIEEICQIHLRNTDCSNSNLDINLDLQSEQAPAVVSDKLSAAMKVLVSERLRDGCRLREDGKTYHSKEFMDALETLNSDKQVFLKLLQDSNNLLVKQTEGSQEAPLKNDQEPNFLPGSTISKEVDIKLDPGEPIAHKHHNFFRRRSKSQDSYPLEGEKILQSSNEIVILKPGPAGSRHLGDESNMSTSSDSRDLMHNKVQGDRHASHFSFTEIKRRLKHVMGKERQGVSSYKILYRSSSEHQNQGDADKSVGGENIGWKSPNRNHFYTEKFARPSYGPRRGDKVGKLIDVESASTNESSGYPKPGVSNIYSEAKKHLSAMLNNGDANFDQNQGQLPKPLGRILSLPEYKDSPSRSPEKDTEDSFITAQMRLSSTNISHGLDGSSHQHGQEKPDGCISPSEHNIGKQMETAGENNNGTGESPDSNCTATCEVIYGNPMEEISCPVTDVITSEGAPESEERNQTIVQEEDKILNDPDIPSDTYATSEDVEDVHNAKPSSQCLDLESSKDDQQSSSPLESPSSSVKSKVEDPGKAAERTGQPSPISVLEPLSSEDDISPPSTIDRKVDYEIHPRKIHFEEPSSSVSDIGVGVMPCMADGESPFDYVEAVLLGSGLNWDEYLLKWLSSDLILDPSLFEEVELFSSRRNDQRLLFDCTNEVLKDVCDRYFGCFITTSIAQQSTRPAPRGMNLITEIWEGVERHLLHHPPSKSLDQLVKGDMTKSGTWMDPHLDIQHIGIKMGEAIFEEVVEDTISSLVDDNPECAVFPKIPQENEISVDS